jgi:hypothetical protein
MKGLQNKLGENPDFDAKRAHAFSYEDMEKTDKMLSKKTDYKSESYLIISKLAFYLWLRIDEALKLKWKHLYIDEQQHLSNHLIHQIRINESKTNNNDKKGCYIINPKVSSTTFTQLLSSRRHVYTQLLTGGLFS